VFTSEMHRDTVETNSRLVDDNERLQRQLSALQDEILVLKQNAGPKRSESGSSGGLRSPVSVGIKTTSAFIGSDGKVPGACPLGGCSHYETVLRGNDTMKNFQNHMNNTHRVCDCCTICLFSSVLMLFALPVQDVQVLCRRSQEQARGDVRRP
jgi:hypothetical protein